MILKGSTIAITGIPIDEKRYKTDKKITDEAILKLLATPMDKESQKKKLEKPADAKPTEIKTEEKKA